MSDTPIHIGLQNNANKISEAIILAGGLGTRLRETLPNIPKCLAPVAGRPFLSHVISHLQQQGINRFIFSLGYKHAMIEKYLTLHHPTLDYTFTIENEPLGTGGAVVQALPFTTTNQVYIVNGDTLFKFSKTAMEQLLAESGAECVIALKTMEHFDRYGTVEIDNRHIIQQFAEKKPTEKGLINGGVYLLNKKLFLLRTFPKKFSFETDYLEAFASQHCFCGVASNEYFIDIGIPEDFHRASAELIRPSFNSRKIDNKWTLFLDRDGVINIDKPGSYILNADEFNFYPGVPEALAKFSKLFTRVIIVTNQRGIARGFMTADDLENIHQKMITAVKTAGGRIDRIYYASSPDEKDFYRKPNPGMALQAKKDFPEISLSKSIMIGNNISDMEFGRAAGMHTIFLSTTDRNIRLPHSAIDLRLNQLKDFADLL